MMQRTQKGEVMLVIMVVMLAVVWIGSGHMGMMGHSVEHSGNPAAAGQHTNAEPPASPEHKESPETQH